MEEAKIHCYEMNERNKCYARRHKDLLARCEQLHKLRKRQTKAAKKQEPNVYSGTEDEIVS